MVFDPQEMALRGRIGAYALHSRYDPRLTTAKARASFLTRFEREVDPERTLPEGERKRRALAARKAHFARLALKSARARARNRPNNGNAAVEQTAAGAKEVDGGRDTAAS
jgi:hypothetical protein